MAHISSGEIVDVHVVDSAGIGMTLPPQEYQTRGVKPPLSQLPDCSLIELSVKRQELQMQLKDALQEKVNGLVCHAVELRKRIDVLRENGYTASATINELRATCKEIGRLNDAIDSMLDGSCFPPD